VDALRYACLLFCNLRIILQMKAQVIIPKGYKRVIRRKIKLKDKALYFSRLRGFYDFNLGWYDVCPYKDVGCLVTKDQVVIRKTK